MILSAMSPAERLDNLLNSSFRSYIEDLFNFRKQIFYEYLLSDLWGLGGSTCLSENMQMGNLTTQTLCWTTCKTMSIISHKCDCCFLLSQAGQPKVNIYFYSKKSNVIFRYLNPLFSNCNNVQDTYTISSPLIARLCLCWVIHLLAPSTFKPKRYY